MIYEITGQHAYDILDLYLEGNSSETIKRYLLDHYHLVLDSRAIKGLLRHYFKVLPQGCPIKRHRRYPQWPAIAKSLTPDKKIKVASWGQVYE